jgi:hypothetical protein
MVRYLKKISGICNYDPTKDKAAGVVEYPIFVIPNLILPSCNKSTPKTKVKHNSTDQIKAHLMIASDHVLLLFEQFQYLNLAFIHSARLWLDLQ